MQRIIKIKGFINYLTFLILIPSQNLNFEHLSNSQATSMFLNAVKVHNHISFSVKIKFEKDLYSNSGL
jgi:hypothetical protein